MSKTQKQKDEELAVALFNKQGKETLPNKKTIQESIKLGERYDVAEENMPIWASFTLILLAYAFLFATFLTVQKGEYEGAVLPFGMFIVLMLIAMKGVSTAKTIIITKVEESGEKDG